MKPNSLLHQRLLGCTNGEASPLVRREPLVQTPSAAAQLAAAGLLLVLALTLMEPASAFGMPWWQRAGFFAAHVFPAIAGAWWISGWLFNRTALQGWPAWRLLALAGAAAGLVLAPWSVTLEMALGVVDLDEPGAAPLPPTVAAWWSEVGDELLHVPPRTALFWVAMNLWVLWRVRPADDSPLIGAPPPPDPAAASPEVPATATLPGLLDRLPARLGRDIVCLQAQQHYLRVVTTRGEDLLLQGLGPAVAELEQRGIGGMQIHRSTWVAWAHVDRLDLRPAALAVVLRDGTRLAVGRRRARAVAEAWQRWPG
jgi:hypothetical protein